MPTKGPQDGLQSRDNFLIESLPEVLSSPHRPTPQPRRKLESPTSRRFSGLSYEDLEFELLKHQAVLRALPLKDNRKLLQRIADLEKEKEVKERSKERVLADLDKQKEGRERTKERTDYDERRSKRQKTNGLASSDDVIVLNSTKGEGPFTQSSPSIDVSTVNGSRDSSGTSSGRLDGPPPRPGLQSSSMSCYCCKVSNSDYVCRACRLVVMEALLKKTKEIGDVLLNDVQQQQKQVVLQEKEDLLKEKVLQEKEDLLKEKEKLLQQALQRQEALKKEVEDAVRETQTLKQKLQEKDSGRECLVCLDEFGDDPSRQRAHYCDCNHANTCFGCAMKLWNRGNSNCPCCNTRAKLFPTRLPAKIFL